MKGQLCPCKRRGCTSLRERWKLTCDACWTEIPWADRARYLRAARAKLTRIKADIGREILRALGRKPAETSPPAATPSPTQAYARTAAILGEREDVETAE